MIKPTHAAVRLLPLAALLSANAQAAVMVDQINLVDHTQGTLAGSGSMRTSANFSGFYGQMQSVTAGLTGTLARLDLQLAVSPEQPRDVAFRIELYQGEPGITGALAPVAFKGFTTADVPLTADAQQGALFTVDLSGLGFQVTAGSKFSYAVTIANERVDRRGPIVVLGYLDGVDEDGFPITHGLEYAGGFNTLLSTEGAHSITAFDRAFRTWVDVTAVPEPASWALMILGFGVAGVALRRSRATAAVTGAIPVT